MWKAVRGSEDCQLRSSLRDAEFFISLLKQLTMNAIRISITKYSKAVVLMNQNLHSTLPLNTSKIQAIIFEPRSLFLGGMKSRSRSWKLLKTIPFAKLAFKSYSIQTSWWLSRSAKWLPEREKSRFKQVSIDSTSAKNVVYTQSLSKCPGNKRVPLTFFVHIHEKKPRLRVAPECEQLANAYTKELSFRTVLQVINCPPTKMSCKGETCGKH